MIQISKSTEYAVRGLIYLSTKPRYETVFIDEISETQEIPRSFLAKIFMSLNKSGIVTSRRGAKGGFMFARDPAEISLLDIIQAVEGPLQINDCISHGAECKCKREKICPAHNVWRKTQEEIIKILDGTNMNMLASEAIALQEAVTV